MALRRDEWEIGMRASTSAARTSAKPKQVGERDGDRIDLSQEGECAYWSDKFGISGARLREVVRQVGPLVSDVQRRLRDRAEEQRMA
jgi:hypothetical protein